MGRVADLLAEATDLIEEEGGTLEEDMEGRATAAQRVRMKQIVKLDRLVDSAASLASRLGL